MHPTIIKELLALLVIIVFIVLYYILLAPMAYILSSLVVVLMSGVFILTTLKRTDRDEREDLHRTIAAESGYIGAGVVLLVAIVIGSINDHSVDPWLFAVLVAMLATRLITRIYLDTKK